MKEPSIINCFISSDGELGFKDVKAINMALLAKQDGRRLSNQHSLLY